MKIAWQDCTTIIVIMFKAAGETINYLKKTDKDTNSSFSRAPRAAQKIVELYHYITQGKLFSFLKNYFQSELYIQLSYDAKVKFQKITFLYSKKKISESPKLKFIQDTLFGHIAVNYIFIINISFSRKSL